MALEKTYNPATVETRLYERWEKSGAFACDPKSKAQPWCIMMPPPNVTGSLHMGHALNFTLQDILARYWRMQGRDVLWQPGTDHAGIATQMMVEKQLAKEGKNMGRREMGREKFLERVWQWKKESGDTITRQLRRLGASCDWSRERFTMDPDLNRGVNRAFVTLYRQGLIYKDKRLVNWDPQLLTAVSDLEVEQKEVKGHMWHFRYPLVDDPEKYICIATTRPETMLGDGAVAVNPKDDRYKHLIGKYATLPLANRQIPIVGDEHADPEKGSGAVKITAAHDFNDFEVWQRHRGQDYFKRQKDGGLINLFDAHARMNENAPEGFRGLDRYAARKKVLTDLEALGLIDQVEDIKHAVPHGDRSGVVIEPWLSEQWYCDARTLAQPAIKAVEENRTRFVPEQWTNTYYAWMRNIEPWCISRQLWWGHQIPAWYGPGISPKEPKHSEQPQRTLTVLTKHDPVVFIAESEDEAIKLAEKHYHAYDSLRDVKIFIGKDIDRTEEGISLKRDEDVLDTWFSSGLWPFSTIGWPKDTEELRRYYPTDVLVTGFDIIFFWVARMLMLGLHLMKEEKQKEGKDFVPFKDVYIHALVRDEKGQKMSKTKGNVIDPLDIIDKYGCDALRFTLANMSTPGRDIKLATGRIEGNRNFATKLWNAARYCEMNECKWDAKFDPAVVKHAVNRWIIGETKQTADKVAGLINDYRFDLSSSAIYDFVWNTFCDWYLEFTKPLLKPESQYIDETRAVSAWVLGQILKVLHPIMPYITEELWGQLTGGEQLLIKTAWPNLSGAEDYEADRAEINWLVKFISTIRAVRAELNVPANIEITLHVMGANDQSKAWFIKHIAAITRLARIGHYSINETKMTKGSAQAIVNEMTLVLPLADVIDLEQERARLDKEIEKHKAEIKRIDVKLANKDFTDRAPPEVVEEHKERKAEAEAMVAKLEAARKSLGG